MSVRYRMVTWNRHKVVYDLAVWGVVAVLIGVFMAASALAHRGAHALDPMILAIRATGLTAIVLMHVVLAIGPLARLTRWAQPLLYNRRHLGVSLFLIALLHAVLVVLYYGSGGVGNPLLVVLLDEPTILGVSFELLGFAALLILFLLASTSHDFWLANLSPRWWKALHMLVYLAYGLVVGHVALGALQAEANAAGPIALGLGVVVLTGLHVAAGLSQLRQDRASQRAGSPGESWVEVGRVDAIDDGGAVTVRLDSGRAVAVFRDGTALHAIDAVCAHQGGPLGEGRIVDGCATCPWHGYQYRPGDGCSPPPYTEKLATYRLRVRGELIELDPNANTPGTPVEPALVEPGPGSSQQDTGASDG